MQTANFSIEDRGDLLHFLDGADLVGVFQKKNLVLRHARLAPGGSPLMGGPGTAPGWRLFFNPRLVSIYDHQLDVRSVKIEEAGHDRVRIRARAGDQKRPIEQGCRLTLRFDEEFERYLWQIELEMHNVGTEPAQCNEYDREYFNFYPTGMIDPKCLGVILDDPPAHTEPRWDNFLYDDRRGGVTRIPMNRLDISSMFSYVHHPRPGGWITVVDSPLGNPAIRLVEDTARQTVLAMCNMMYDLHCRLEPVETEWWLPCGQSVSAAYTVTKLDPGNLARMSRDARLCRFDPAEITRRQFPAQAWHGENNFDQPMRWDQGDHRAFWTPFFDDQSFRSGRVGAVLDHARDVTLVWDQASKALRVRTDSEGRAGWQLSSYNRLPAEPGKRYRITARIRAKNLLGIGTTIGYIFAKDDPSNWWDPPPDCSRFRWCPTRINGTTDWQELTLLTEPAPRFIDPNGNVAEHRIRIIYRHEGRGESELGWFKFEVLPNG